MKKQRVRERERAVFLCISHRVKDEGWDTERNHARLTKI